MRKLTFAHIDSSSHLFQLSATSQTLAVISLIVAAKDACVIDYELRIQLVVMSLSTMICCNVLSML